MKPLLSILATLAATPALAHSGHHLHPHGSDVWLVLLLASVLVGGGVALARAMRRK